MTLAKLFRLQFCPTSEFLRTTWTRKLSHSTKDLFSKIHLIENVNQCSKIVQDIQRVGQPIAVDCEGNTEEYLGLIQVKTFDDQIYLFRTGRNRQLLTSGGLGDLLENPNITKVLHASSVDCLAVYKEGIRLWGVYDTAVAHKVIQFQNEGVSINSTNTLSHNDLCQTYGFPENPFKESMDGELWKRMKLFYRAPTLPKDLILYSAWDVEHLLDIFEITSSMIEPDFVPILNELCECEVLRALDRQLVKCILAERRKEEIFTVFVKNFDTANNKAAFYEAISTIEGKKKILLSTVSRSAHIVLPDRDTAISCEKLLNENPQRFGSATNIRLLAELKFSELTSDDLGLQIYHKKLKEANFIVDEFKARKTIAAILEAKCPIAVEFHLMNFGASISMCVGEGPVLKFDVDPSTVVRYGIGDLISSADVTKIVGRIDTNAVSAVLKICAAQNFIPKNFFEISTASKMFDYLSHGQSIFKTPSRSIREVSNRFGIFTENSFVQMLHLYLIISKSLPEEAKDFLSRKSMVDLSSGYSSSSAQAKEMKKQLRLLYETRAVFIEASAQDEKSTFDFKDSLQDFITQTKLKCKILFLRDLSAIVSIQDDKGVTKFMNEFRSSKNPIHQTYAATVSPIDLKSVDVIQSRALTAEELKQNLEPFFTRLAAVNYFDIVQQL